MAQKLPTVNPTVRTNGGLGSSNTERLQSSFSKSPIGTTAALDDNGGLLDNPIREFFERVVLNGVVENGGFMVANFDRDFTGAPGYGSVMYENPGDPASAWVPNPSSPTEDFGDQHTLAPPPPGFGSSDNVNEQYGSGQTATAPSRDPAVSSNNISRQKLGGLALGVSTPTD